MGVFANKLNSLANKQKQWQQLMFFEQELCARRKDVKNQHFCEWFGLLFRSVCLLFENWWPRVCLLFGVFLGGLAVSNLTRRLAGIVCSEQPCLSDSL